MCTLVILRRPEHEWPVIIGANRDEMIERAALPPGRHWPDRAEVVGGRDLLAGGSWLGVNDWGVVAAVLNRHGSLGPVAALRSRGELVLEALDHADAVAAATALSDLDPGSYRSFNLIVADNRDAFWLRHAETGKIEVRPIKAGLSLIAAGEIDDLRPPRLALAKPRLRAASPPDPDRDDWTAWQDILGDDTVPPGAPAEAALRFLTERGYGTVSSAIVALPAIGDPERRPVFRFAAWQPEATPWRTIAG
jgi:transport and Golgi organization protein 2